MIYDNSDIDPDVIRTLWGEARGEGDTGLQAVASVIANRARAAGSNLGDVVRAPGQFAGLGAGAKLNPSSPDYQRVAAAVAPILRGQTAPITDADHFYAPRGVSKTPAWDDGSGTDLGNHRFFKLGGATRPVGVAVAQPAPQDQSDPLADMLGPEPSTKGAAPAAAQANGDPLADLLGPDPKAAPAAGHDPGVYNADTGAAATDAQAHTGRMLQAAGRIKLDPTNPGSGPDNPMMQVKPGETPEPGKWFIDLAGVLQQVPDKGLAIARADEAHRAALLAKTRLGPLDDFTTAATAPVNDEMAGGIAALGQGAYNVGARLMGAPVNVSMGDRYKAALEAERAAQDARDKHDPVAGVLGRVAGGLLVGPEGVFAGGAAAAPALAEAAAPSLLKTAAVVGGTGAAYGAADARGDLSHRAAGAVQGGALALGTGVALHGALGVGGALARYAPRLASAVPGVVPAAKAVGGVFGRAGDAFDNAVGPTLDRLGELVNPNAPAYVPPLETMPPRLPPGTTLPDAKLAAGYVQRVAQGAGKSMADLSASDAATGMEALGTRGTSAAAMLARRDGATGDLADNVLLSRRDNRPDRILGALSDASGIDPAAVNGDFTSTTAQMKAAAAPLWREAHDAPPPQSTLLDFFATRPSAKAAMSKAYRIAADEGRDPEALGLRDMEAPASAPEVTADTSGAPTFGETLKVLRSVRDPTLNQGPTAMQFIARNGGIADDGGEISGMDGELWHRDKPFMNKLINPQGDGADMWAERLRDAGYFPDMHPDELPSIGDVHGLIADELAGAPTYARSADPRAVQLKAQVDDMEEHLNGLGYDHRSMSDEDVARALNPVEDGAHPYAPPPMEPVWSAEPNLQSWQYLKRGLDSQIETYRDGTTGKLNLDDQGRALVGLRGRVRDELVRVNPAYGRALAASGEPMSMESAFNAAPAMMKDSVPEPVFNDRFARMSPAEQQAVRAGAVNDAYAKARRGGLTLRQLDRPIVQGKFTTLFGEDKAAKIAATLKAEQAMTKAERSVPPGAGSPTMGLQQAAREADGDPSALGGMAQDAAHALAKHPGNPISAGLHFIGRQVMKGARFAQAPMMPKAVRDEAGRMLVTMSPAELRAHLEALLPDVKIKPRMSRGLIGSGAAEERRRLGLEF